MMNKFERENWIINLEDCADTICANLDERIVSSVLARYGARSIRKLNPIYYSEVYSELYAITADC